MCKEKQETMAIVSTKASRNLVQLGYSLKKICTNHSTGVSSDVPGILYKLITLTLLRDNQLEVHTHHMALRKFEKDTLIFRLST